MAKIFVSYRRHDNPYVAQSLKEHLERRFGEDSVFLDIDNIPIGVDFREHIDRAVRQCDVMLVLIGDAWLAKMPGKERNRLFDSRDFVRAEIEAALHRTIPIVPLLVENAQMPSDEDLPQSIRDLSYRNAAELRAGPDLSSHMNRLVKGLARMFENAVAAVREAILKRFGQLTDEHVFIEPHIPTRQLQDALASYAPQANTQQVVLLYEQMEPRGGRGALGLLLTDRAVFWKTVGSAQSQFVLFEGVQSIERPPDGMIYLNGSVLCIPANDGFELAVVSFLESLKAQYVDRH